MDIILGHPLVSSFPFLEDLSKWTHENNLLLLYDISEWDHSGTWRNWKALNPPQHLKLYCDQFLSFLQGKYPFHQRTKDLIGWGNKGLYYVKEGYQILDSNTTQPQDNFWKKVWNTDYIPKVNSFFLHLMHNKILTVENLTKRRIEGPSRCVLCNSHPKKCLPSFSSV